MKTCPKCHKEYEEFVFCPVCGTQLEEVTEAPKADIRKVTFEGSSLDEYRQFERPKRPLSSWAISLIFPALVLLILAVSWLAARAGVV